MSNLLQECILVDLVVIMSFAPPQRSQKQDLDIFYAACIWVRVVTLPVKMWLVGRVFNGKDQYGQYIFFPNKGGNLNLGVGGLQVKRTFYLHGHPNLKGAM